MGLHHSYLSKLERGKNAPLSMKRLEALARELSEEPELLMALSGRLPDEVVRLVAKKPRQFMSCLSEFVHEASREAREADS